ncbi:MAG: ATP-binding cassette domain-containing protein [Pseudomonadota bacterium]
MSRFLVRLLQLFWQDRRAAIFILFVLVVELSFSAFLPLGLMLMIDHAIVPGNFNLLLWLVGIALVGVVINSVLGLLGDRSYAKLVSHQITDFYRDIFEHIQALPLSYYQRVKPGDLLARYNTDLSAVEAFLIPARQLFLGIMSLAVNAVILLTLQWQLALVVFLGFALSFILPTYFGDKAFWESKKYKDEQGGVNALVQENVLGQETVKSLGIQSWSLRNLCFQLNPFRESARRAHFFNYLLDRTAEIGVLIIIVITLCTGSILAYHEVISIGVFSAFVTILFSMSYIISDITWLAPQIVQARAGLERIDELMSEPVVRNDGNTPVGALRKEIFLSNVYFSYTGEGYELEDVTVGIAAGSYVAFVGPSGSGKSTVANILMRYYMPDKGDVCWDGVAFSDISSDAFHQQVAIVSQSTFLFNLSIRENIRLGSTNASDGDIEDLARKLGIHEMIVAFSKGYDTIVGVGGVQLSGGQRQRIAIVRALLGRPSVLILDEATSALDPLSENTILSNIRQLMKGKTVISVTHRLTTAEDDDRVYVLDNGRVVEQGVHRVLCKAQGMYQMLYEKQRGFRFSDDGKEVSVSGHRLRAIPLLDSLDESMLEDIANFFVTQHFDTQERIITEGEDGDTFYLIVRGSVGVLKKESEEVTNRIATLSDGDFFGEIALLEDVPRTATIEADTPVILLALQRKVFQSLLNQAPHLKEKLKNRYSS